MHQYLTNDPLCFNDSVYQFQIECHCIKMNFYEKKWTRRSGDLSKLNNPTITVDSMHDTTAKIIVSTQQHLQPVEDCLDSHEGMVNHDWSILIRNNCQ